MFLSQIFIKKRMKEQQLLAKTCNVIDVQGCFSLKKTQDWILKSINGFCVSLLNRLIQDHPDHGASKEWKNPCTY